MIKKLSTSFIILIISVLIVINYLSYKSPKEDIIITQEKVYSLNKDNNLNVLLYANTNNAYLNKDAISKIYLVNDDSSKKIELSLLNINKKGSYKYLKETYSEYSYNFILPVLSDDYYIKEAYLHIRLKNNNEQKFKIGSFDYYVIDEELNVIELYGSKYDDFPTLKEVSFKFSLTEDVFIEHIYISKSLFTYVGKTICNNELLTVNFSKLDKITDSLVIKIEYQLNNSTYTTVLPYFIYYEDFTNPLSYSVLNNLYVLN